MLEYLSRFHDQQHSKSWVTYSSLASYLESFYFDVATIQRHLTVLIENGSIEASSSASKDDVKVSTFRITTRGAYHITHLVGEFQYLDAMCVDTPIIDSTARTSITETTLISGRIARTRAFLTYLQACADDLADAEGKDMCNRMLVAALAECDDLEQRAATSRTRRAESGNRVQRR